MSCQTIPEACDERWKEIRALYANQPAVWDPNGDVLRTFEDVEAEAQHFEMAFAKIPEKCVATLDLDNHPSWPALVLAAFRSRRILMPLDPSATEGTKRRLEALCKAVLRISATDHEQLEWKFLAPPFSWEEMAPDFLKVSSGTGGHPQVICFTKNQLLADCDQICETMQLNAKDLQYGVIPFSHSYGFSSLITPLLWRGIPLVASRDRLPYAIAHGIHSTGATVFPAIPSIFQALCNKNNLSLRLCISAGALLRSGTATAFYKNQGLKIHSFYGASECGGICYDATDDPIPPEGFVGAPMQGVSLDWNASRISVRSKAVGLGYYPEPSKGNSSFLGSIQDRKRSRIGLKNCDQERANPQSSQFLGSIQDRKRSRIDLKNCDQGRANPQSSQFLGCFQTADWIKKCGNGFQIVGRTTDWIEVGAKKVHPAEIERVLLEYPGVREAIVFGIDIGERGQQIHAVLAMEETVPIAVLRQYCQRNFSAWQVPRHIHIVKSIPVNERGKINRRELAEKFQAGVTNPL